MAGPRSHDFDRIMIIQYELKIDAQPIPKTRHAPNDSGHVCDRSRCASRPPLHAPEGSAHHPVLRSIAKEIVPLDTARRSSALALFYIFVRDAGVAHELHVRVGTARYPVGLIANIAFGGHSVVAIDLVRVPIESASVGSSARRGLAEGAPVAKQHGSRVERAGIGAYSLTRVSNLAQGGIAIEMPIGSHGTPLRSPAIAPKLESAVLAHESSRAVGTAGEVRRERARAVIAFLRERIVACVRRPVTRATTGAAARHLGPSPSLAQEAPIVSGTNPLVFDVAFGSGSRRGPTCHEDREDDRSGDYGDSRRSSTQGQAGIPTHQTRTRPLRKVRKTP
jgi:hypothetical protein